MTSPTAPMCMWCSRLDRRTFTCDAFPDGIPKALTIGGADHRLPLAGDNGILFRPKSKEALSEVEQIWGEEPVLYEGEINPPDPVGDPAGDLAQERIEYELVSNVVVVDEFGNVI